jgi:hypothetical protein
MVALNLRHAHNNYGILDSNLALQVLAQTNSSGGSTSNGGGSSSSSGTTRPKVKMCRQVACIAEKKYTIDLTGCVKIKGKKICGLTIGGTYTETVPGKKENCTGGNDFEDCDACQDDCIPNE